MIPSSIFRTAAAVLVASAALAGPAQAQDAGRGFLIGVGGGVGRVAEPSSHVSKLSPALHLHAGWRFSRSLSLVVEGSMNAIGSTRLDSARTRLDSGEPAFAPRAVRLQTESLLASLQVGDPATFYLRPGVGFARHAFATLTPVSNDQIVDGTSFEWSPAAGIAAGRQVRVIPRFPLNVEAAAFYSRGEDSTSPRWTAALQVVRELHF